MYNIALLSLYDTCLAVVNKNSFESHERFKILPIYIIEDLSSLKKDESFRVNPSYNRSMLQKFKEQVLPIYSKIDLCSDKNGKIELVKQLFNYHCSNIIHLKYIPKLKEACLLTLESLQQEGFPKEEVQRYISIISNI